MADLILLPIQKGERELAFERWRDDRTMTETLRHAYATQDSLDADIKGWARPAFGDVADIISWLESARQSNFAPTLYDYRRHARSYAAKLLFKVTNGVPSAMASRVVNEDKWSEGERLDYWRCIAICSAHWGAAQ